MLADGPGKLDLSRDGEHSCVQRALVEPVDQSVTVVDDLLDVDPVEGDVEGGEHPVVQARDRAHASYGAVPGGAGSLECATQVAEDVVGLTRELDARGSRASALGVAVEEDQPRPALQPGQSLAGRGLGEVELARRGTAAA